MFLNNKQVTGEIKKKKKILETNDMTTQNMNAAKAVFRGKCIAIKSYLKKQEKHKIFKICL